MNVRFGLAICAMMAAASASSGHAQSPVDIQMSLSKTKVMLGEPVWVNVAVTNRSSDALWVGMGSDCFGVRPIKFVIPGAGPALPENERRCSQRNVVGGSCPSSYPPPLLEPGDTLERRYVLEGDFRIEHPGTYQVQVKKVVTYWVAPAGEKGPDLTRNAERETAEDDFTLDIRESDPAQLLRLEQGLVAEAAKPTLVEPEPRKSSAKGETAYQKARAVWDIKRMNASDAQGALIAGVMEYPVAGMETVFNDWFIAGGPSANPGLRALSRLNTAAARAMLAKAAEGSPDLYARWVQHEGVGDPEQAEKILQRSFALWRRSALHALSRTGDPTYAPLFEKLTSDTSTEVRREAILDLGMVGGKQELPKLLEIIRNDSDANDRGAAIAAMGDTRSLAAFPLLLQLFTLPDAGEPLASNLALVTLTHHVVPIDGQVPAAQYQGLWQAWWRQNNATARAYGPFECEGNIGALGPAN